MGREFRNIRKFVATLGLLVFLAAHMLAQADDSTDYKIEQVYINKPDVTAYYRSPDADGALEVYLGGERLEILEDAGFEETGEAVEYYILLDVSASIRTSRFEDIKASLTQFRADLREQDQMLLLTFGDTVRTVLNGNESVEDANAVIAQLVNSDQNTVLFEAIDEAADMITKAGDTSEKRRIVAVISDGKDCADNTRSVESVQTKLIARGIPVYTIAVENNQGDSETEIADYRGKFGSLSRNTGGIPWVISDSASVLDGLNFIKSTVMNSRRMKLRAASNKISNTNEDFVIKFLNAGDMSDTCSVLVARSQPDDTAPEITSLTSEEENSIRITFSEAVENADVVSNYSVKKDNKSIPVYQVRNVGEAGNVVELVFSQELYAGEYVVDLVNITDVSNESNALANFSVSLRTTWQEPTEEPTEEAEDEGESPGTIILRWWPIVLTVVVAVLIIMIIVIVRKIQKKKGILIIDDQVVPASEVNYKQHVAMAQNTLPNKQIVLWISNGIDEPKRMELLVNGSSIIGRSMHCDVYCDDPMMSKQHFVLEVDGSNLFISDLQSRNGTTVNGIEIKERYQLSPHDEIMAGSLKFRIEWPESY